MSPPTGRGARHRGDVGYGRLAWSLPIGLLAGDGDRADERARPAPTILPSVPAVVVADLSFISLRLALPHWLDSRPGSDLVVLVKPQFERDERRWDVAASSAIRTCGEALLAEVLTTARSLALEPLNVIASPLPGPAGNVEFPVHLVSGFTDPATIDVEAAVGEGKAFLR